MVQWRLPNISYCSCHCWISHIAGWEMCVGISVGQTTSQSKNTLTYIEFGPCSKCCLTPWNTASRDAEKLLCQRQGEGSPFPSLEKGRLRYQQRGLLQVTTFSLTPKEQNCHRHLKAKWVNSEAELRESSSSIKENWSGENISQRTINLGSTSSFSLKLNVPLWAFSSLSPVTPYPLNPNTPRLGRQWYISLQNFLLLISSSS